MAMQSSKQQNIGKNDVFVVDDYDPSIDSRPLNPSPPTAKKKKRHRKNRKVVQQISSSQPTPLNNDVSKLCAAIDQGKFDLVKQELAFSNNFSPENFAKLKAKAQVTCKTAELCLNNADSSCSPLGKKRKIQAASNTFEKAIAIEVFIESLASQQDTQG